MYQRRDTVLILICVEIGSHSELL
ncbi:MAG: hypothetical protein MR902_07445 [Campylobacter sp.]|nr:hypothetical protein [Campylobacter sp.]